MNVGLISDTHGTLRQNAIDALARVDHIIHAGDIGDESVIASLERIAPVTAVRGNTDGGSWAQKIALTEMITLHHKTIYVLHDLATLDLDPSAAGIHIIISGHTHCAEIKSANGILYINPGSASFRRRGNPLSVGRIALDSGPPRPRIITL